MNFPLFMQASITRVPLGNCFHSPSICTLTIATGVAVSLMFEKNRTRAVQAGIERQSIGSPSARTSKRRVRQGNSYLKSPLVPSVKVSRNRTSPNALKLLWAPAVAVRV
jgi:hypothetical protein